MGFVVDGDTMTLLRGNILSLSARRVQKQHRPPRDPNRVVRKSSRDTLKRISWDDAEGFLVGVENDHRFACFELATNLSHAQA
jgi:hypothetical protein